MKVIKRDGTLADFDVDRIRKAIYAAAEATNVTLDEEEYEEMLNYVKVHSGVFDNENVSVEKIQDCVEEALMEFDHYDIARNYIVYRNERTDRREMNSVLMNTLNDLFTQGRGVNDAKRENANINTDAPMGVMLKVGSEASKYYALSKVLKPAHSVAHKEGFIHIHDLDFFMTTETCVQIPLGRLLAEGFTTGHGYLRPPQGVFSALALACIVLQSSQNDMHGGQSIPCFDYDLAPYVAKTLIKTLCETYMTYVSLKVDTAEELELTEMRCETLKVKLRMLYANCGTLYNSAELEDIITSTFEISVNICKRLLARAYILLENTVYQAMESFVHNLNTMNSRAGSQVPFSSVNLGTCTSEEGRCITRNLLKAVDAGLGQHEISFFPVVIFKMKTGVNYNPEDKNYDLFKLAIKVSAARLFPTFSNLDAPYNAQYYEEGRPETEVAYMGCRTRVIGNVHDPEREIVMGRGNLSFTTINLPRLGIIANGDESKFYELLDTYLNLVADQLYDRYLVQAQQRVLNYPFLMGQREWIDSDKLGLYDTVGEILKHGTLAIGYIGLAECLTALYGEHHAQSKETWQKGYNIIKYMRDFCDKRANSTKMNYSLIMTPAEGLAGRFVRMDKKKYGEIPGVTDKDYYTNSSHVPVSYKITAAKKIEAEAPFHALANGGHITYIEMNGDPRNNLMAFEDIIRYMHDKNVGYMAINHAVDLDPACGYVGIIGDECPRCHRRDGEPMTRENYERVRGYVQESRNMAFLGDMSEGLQKLSDYKE